MRLRLSFKRALAGAAVFAAATGLFIGTNSTVANAATSSACTGGGFSAVLPDGRVITGSSSVKLSNANLTESSLIKVRGKYIEYDFAPLTGNIYNYVYTGAANPDSMTDGQRLTVMASKTLDIGPVLRKQVEVRLDASGANATLLSSGNGKVKIQSKDCATGGIFQQEAETSRPVVATHTLGTGLFYYVNPYTGKINFGDGARFAGKDSAQVATRLSQTDFTSSWSIASGGRMGQVLGEDAVELSAGPTNCVQDCQARNQVRGSLPVTDPAFSG